MGGKVKFRCDLVKLAKHHLGKQTGDKYPEEKMTTLYKLRVH